MSNILIGFGNRVDAATLSGGGWRAALPLANLQDRRPTRVARSLDASPGNTFVSIDLGSARPVRAVGIVNHNLSQAATLRLRASLASDLSAPQHDETIPAWSLTFDEDLPWEADNWWTGTAGDEYVRHPWVVAWMLPATISPRYLRIDIDDPGNPDGYVQLGRLFVGPAFQPALNASYGLADQWQDTGSTERGLSGAVFATAGRRYRTTQMTLDWLEAGDEASRWWEMQRAAGRTGEVLYLPYPHDRQQTQRYGYLGVLRELSALEYPYFNVRKSALSLEEIL